MSKTKAANPAADLRSIDRASKEIELYNLLARQAENLRALDAERRPPRELTKRELTLEKRFFDTVGDAVVTVTKDQLRRRFPDDPDPVHEQTVFALANERDRLDGEIKRLKREGVRVIGAQDAAALEAARGGRGAAEGSAKANTPPGAGPENTTLNARAMGLLLDHPDWKLKDFAKALNLHERTLSKPKYAGFRDTRKALRRQRGLSITRGHKSKDGTVEAADGDVEAADE